jgi:hypothetical protein
LEDPSNECEDCIYEWLHIGGGIHRETTTIQGVGERVPHVPLEKGIV